MLDQVTPDQADRPGRVQPGNGPAVGPQYPGPFVVPGPEAVDHLDALCFGRTGRAVLQAYAGGLHGIDQWLRSLGGNTAPFDPPPGRLPAPFPSWPHFPAGKTIRYRTVAGGTGRRGEAARLAGPLNGLLGTPNDYAWSPVAGHHDVSVHADCAFIR